MSEIPRSRFAVEGLAEEQLEETARDLDVALCRANIEYAQKREGGRLGPAEVMILTPGTYARYRAARVAEGVGEAQVKDPIVAIDETAWEMLLKSADCED